MHEKAKIEQKTQNFPIGISNWRQVIEGNFYYVDKSFAIKDIINDGQVIVLTRPRRFGKTLFMSMLSYFFAEHVNGKPTAQLFENALLKKQSPAHFLKHQGQYSVIFLSFKDIKGDSFQETINDLKGLLNELFITHKSILTTNKLDESEIKIFNRIKNKTAPYDELKKALKLLIQYTYKAYDKPVVVLIDEYDTPIQAAYLNDYYDKMISFMRFFLGSALKDSDFIFKAIITGILRVAKESLFSGLNNLGLYTVLDNDYSQAFGFTEKETENLLNNTQLAHKACEIKAWYNGYQFRNHTIYNPWSIINCLKRKGELQPYWVNTSDNQLLTKILPGASSNTKIILEKLLQNDSFYSVITQHTHFKDLLDDEYTLYSLLLFSGYLTAKKLHLNEDGDFACELQIPNKELLGLLNRQIRSWFTSKLSLKGYQKWLSALSSGEIEVFIDGLKQLVKQSVSFFDATGNEPERFYHGFVLGIVAGLKNTHRIYSNRESGYGRYDIALIPLNHKLPGIIFEFKTTNSPFILTKVAKQGLKQIKTKAYNTEFIIAKVTQVHQIAIAFCGKFFEAAYNTEKVLPESA